MPINDIHKGWDKLMKIKDATDNLFNRMDRPQLVTQSKGLLILVYCCSREPASGSCCHAGLIVSQLGIAQHTPFP
jgi:hypothetical protein